MRSVLNLAFYHILGPLAPPSEIVPLVSLVIEFADVLQSPRRSSEVRRSDQDKQRVQVDVHTMTEDSEKVSQPTH